jgi:ribosomal-protein-alanine N-acetyltransferase
MNKFPILQTERLSLREIQPTDAQAVFDSFSQARVTKYINRGPMQSIQEAAELVEIRTSLFKRGIGIRWAITKIEDPAKYIGSCGCYKMDKSNHSMEIGYDLCPDYWRQGIMTEAVKAMINFAYSGAFFFYPNRIEALTYTDHSASIGLLKKLGFKDEGIRREAGFWENQYHDLKCFSLLRDEWMSSPHCNNNFDGR